MTVTIIRPDVQSIYGLTTYQGYILFKKLWWWGIKWPLRNKNQKWRCRGFKRGKSWKKCVKNVAKGLRISSFWVISSKKIFQGTLTPPPPLLAPLSPTGRNFCTPREKNLKGGGVIQRANIYPWIQHIGKNIFLNSRTSCFPARPENVGVAGNVLL